MIACSVCKRTGCSIIETYKGYDDPCLHGWQQGSEDGEAGWICPRHAKELCKEAKDNTTEITS